MQTARKEKLVVCKCNRCGHLWASRMKLSPSHCAACKSAYWNKPRKFKMVQGKLKKI